VSAPSIAEFAIGMVLMLNSNIERLQEAQYQQRWARSGIELTTDIAGRTMLVLGLGGIGTETARKASALGMRVVATRNSSREGPEFVDKVGLSDEMYELAGEADFVVNALPLTDKTNGPPSTYSCTHAHTHVCMYTMHAHPCPCTYSCTHAHTHTCMHTHAQAPTHVPMHTHTHTHTHACTPMPKHLLMYHVPMRAHAHTHTHACTHAHMHASFNLPRRRLCSESPCSPQESVRAQQEWGQGPGR